MELSGLKSKNPMPNVGMGFQILGLTLLSHRHYYGIWNLYLANFCINRLIGK